MIRDGFGRGFGIRDKGLGIRDGFGRGFGIRDKNA